MYPKKTKKKWFYGFALVAAILSQPVAVAAQAVSDTFTNPLLQNGADPWVISFDGSYYFMATTGRNLTIWKTSDITDLRGAKKKVVWTPPATGPYSHEIWAPELHRFDGKWYLYFAADGGNNNTHRIFALENSAKDPLEGDWVFKGKVADATDKWAIDPTAFENAGRRYFLWSGWEGDTNGRQVIYMAEMSNPWTISSPRVMLSYPKYGWERVYGSLHKPNGPRVEVNEGPEILQHDDKIFVTYSASGCWTDDYELGMLEANADADLLNAKSWKKFDHPVFKQDPKAGVFGPGHNGFFKSPDGKEDWIIYHANPMSEAGCGGARSPRIQKFTWNADGTPDFGKPVSTNTPLAKPSR
jgi:GH43 family beta-xylosidase